jgi:hypothetical protein
LEFDSGGRGRQTIDDEEREHDPFVDGLGLFNTGQFFEIFQRPQRHDAVSLLQTFSRGFTFTSAFIDRALIWVILA